MDSYGVGDSNADWPNNILSTRTVVYPNGTICRTVDNPQLMIDESEVSLCQRLSADAKTLIGDREVGMGSESSDPFSPFFCCSNTHDDRITKLDGNFIRERFGGTIFPLATITVEKLAEDGVWWSEVSTDCEGDATTLADWRSVIQWFEGHSEISNSVFVRIGDRVALWDAEGGDMPEGTEMTGGVLPRLVVGLTAKNSLVGLFGHSVQT